MIPFFSHRVLYVVGLLFLAAGIGWSLFIIPDASAISPDFTYVSSIDSTDNFYDSAKKTYAGPTKSKTTFYYNAVSYAKNVLIIRNVFDVRTSTGASIFSVERIYAVDPQTGMHVPSYVSRDRDGYLFAPRNLNKEPYTYWHANYDTPARMEFVAEEEINGLSVYRYEADVFADQTENLGHLSNIPETRGVNVDAHLTVWVEPKTGYLVNYEDDAIAYFYDQKTKERLFPWNHFMNTYTDESMNYHAGRAEDIKTRTFIRERVIPGAFILWGMLLILWGVRRSRFLQFSPHASVKVTDDAPGV